MGLMERSILGVGKHAISTKEWNKEWAWSGILESQSTMVSFMRIRNTDSEWWRRGTEVWWLDFGRKGSPFPMEFNAIIEFNAFYLHKINIITNSLKSWMPMMRISPIKSTLSTDESASPWVPLYPPWLSPSSSPQPIVENFNMYFTIIVQFQASEELGPIQVRALMDAVNDLKYEKIKSVKVAKGKMGDEGVRTVSRYIEGTKNNKL